jgi:AAA domain
MDRRWGETVTTAILAPAIENVLAKFPDHKSTGRGKWMAKCPCHDDRHASLSISEGTDGRALIHCHAGCQTMNIIAAIGLVMSDLMPLRDPSHNGNGQSHQKQIVAEYDYVNAEGDLLYQAVRYEPKEFRQRRPDGRGGWLHNMDGITRVLYRLDQLQQADPDQVVFVVEGEKDADRLATEGLIATTNVGGAGKWRPEYSECLRGSRAVILSDNDEAGRNHGAAVARSLSGKAADVRVVDLPGLPPKGDVSDYLDAGGTAKSLLALVDATPIWKPADLSKAIESAMPNIPIGDKDTEPVLELISAGELTCGFKELKALVIDQLMRETEVANLVSTSKANKTHTAISIALSICTGRAWLNRFPVRQGNVLYIDAELHRQTFAHRLARIAKAMGVLSSEFADKLDVLTLRGRLRDLFALESFFRSIPKWKYTIIVIDAIYRLMPRGFDENSNADITALYNRVDQYAELTGSAILCVHHSTKGNQSGKDVVAIGSGAGAQSRAVDAHITMRQHREDDCVVLEAALRSFPPFVPLVLRWEYPTFRVDDTLQADDLREPGARKKAETPEWTPETFAETFVCAIPMGKPTITVKAAKRGVKASTAAILLAAAVDAGVVYKWNSGDRRTAHKFATVPQPAEVKS